MSCVSPSSGAFLAGMTFPTDGLGDHTDQFVPFAEWNGWLYAIGPMFGGASSFALAVRPPQACR